MSFFLTRDQFVAGTKDVTRRKGWKFLKPGDRVMAVEKGQGLKKGEKVKRLGVIEILSVRREPLWYIIKNPADVRREGFPKLTEREFIRLYCKANGGYSDQMVTRIEFRKTPFGCLCESFTHRVAGDGCEICQPKGGG